MTRVLGVLLLGALFLLLVPGAAQGPMPPAASPVPAAPPGSTSGACPIARPYVVDHTLLGVNVSTMHQTFDQGVADRVQAFGASPVVRVFDSGAPPANAWRRRVPALEPGTAVVTSFRMPPQEVLAGTYDARLRHFFGTAPRGAPIFWSYYHEPEAAVLARAFTPAQFRAAFRHIAVLAAGLCRANLYPTLILTGYTVDPASHRDWRTYYPGSGFVSVMAWDTYNSTLVTPQSYVDPAVLFADCLRASRRAGKPWALAETGSALVPGDPASARAAWLTALGGFARRTRAAFVTYFDGADRIDFRLLDGPSVQAWRGQVHG